MTSFDERVAKLVLAAQTLSEKTSGFFETKGPGAGDHATNQFMSRLRRIAAEMFGQDYSEKSVTPGVDFSFDFYFPEEATVVEFAFGLHNPLSEYERDIFKCLLAKEHGRQVSRLVFVGKPGAITRQEAPGPKAIAEFVQSQFGLEVEVFELQRR